VIKPFHHQLNLSEQSGYIYLCPRWPLYWLNESRLPPEWVVEFYWSRGWTYHKCM